jgi:hypothetical protein
MYVNTVHIGASFAVEASYQSRKQEVKNRAPDK